MDKSCTCGTKKCEKHQKPAKDKCRRYYENERKLNAAILLSVLLGIAGIVCSLVWGPVLALVSCVGLLVVLAWFRAIARRWNAWRYLIHPYNRFHVEQLERLLSFVEKLRKKIKIQYGDESGKQEGIVSSLEALRHRKLVEYEEEKATSTSIYSDRRFELSDQLESLDVIIAGMRYASDPRFSAVMNVRKNSILEKIRRLAYPYLEDMPKA